jgi:hypothetical protein
MFVHEARLMIASIDPNWVRFAIRESPLRRVEFNGLEGEGRHFNSHKLPPLRALTGSWLVFRVHPCSKKCRADPDGSNAQRGAYSRAKDAKSLGRAFGLLRYQCRLTWRGRHRDRYRFDPSHIQQFLVSTSDHPVQSLQDRESFL